MVNAKEGLLDEAVEVRTPRPMRNAPKQCLRYCKTVSSAWSG